MEKFKPKGKISRNLEASENRGLEKFNICCQEQSIWYYLLLGAFRRGSVWFQWGLDFIPSNSWTKHGTRRYARSQGDTELVPLSRSDHKRLCSFMPKTSHMTDREFSSFYGRLLDFSVQIFYLCLECQGPKESFFHFSPVGRSNINLVPPESQKFPASLNKNVFI